MIEMSIAPIAAAIKIIANASVSPVKNQLERNEKVIQILKKLNLNPEHPPREFTAVYRYALVKYGIGKSSLILELFRQKEIISAFRQAFDRNDESILIDESEDFLEWNILGDRIKAININIRKEITDFQSIFTEVSDSTRTTSEVIRDRNLNSFGGKIDAILNTLPILRQQWTNYVSFHGASEYVHFVLEDKAISLGMAEPDDTDRQEIFLGQGFRLAYNLPFNGSALLIQNTGSVWASTRLNKRPDKMLPQKEQILQERLATVKKGHWIVPTSGRYLKEKTELGLHRFVLILSKKPFPEKIQKLVTKEPAELSNLSLSAFIEYIESDDSNAKLIVVDCDVVR